KLVSKFKKKHYQQQRQQALSVTILASPTIVTNTDNINNSTAYDSPLLTTTTNSSSTLFKNSTANTSPLISKYTSIHDHVSFITDLIEKFSRKTFVSVILKQNEHYELQVAPDGETLKAVIKCNCGGRLMLPIRSDTSKFILSNFYAHLTTSTCSMVNNILKEEKKLANRELQTEPINNSVPQSSTAATNNNKSPTAKQIKRKDNDNSSATHSSSTKFKKLKR
ncbi:unnamed protein product, partial [Rotaria sp. Silwood1]